jgi:hypothetical protein
VHVFGHGGQGPETISVRGLQHHLYGVRVRVRSNSAKRTDATSTRSPHRIRPCRSSRDG